MSQISSVYAALKTRITTLLPNHVRIPNAYKLDENLEPALKQGWAIAVGPGTNSNRKIGCKASIVRQFTIHLTRKLYAQEMDSDAKETGDKNLLEDQFLLLKDIEKEPTLGDSNAVTKAVWAEDSGIQFIFADKDNFISLSTTIEVEYFETL